MDGSAAYMGDLSVIRLRFTLRARELVRFGPQPGSQLRGGLYGALSRQFCPETGLRHLPGHSNTCPVCWLLATEDPQAERGRDLPRPLAIQAPGAHTQYHTGESFSFAVTLFGKRAASSLPFLLRALSTLGEEGAGSGRGRFDVRQVEEAKPLTDECWPLLDGMRLSAPSRPLAAEDIDRQAETLDRNTLRVQLLSPLRLGEDGRLMRRIDVDILLRRLLERCQALAGAHGQGSADREAWRDLSLRLSSLAQGFRVSADHTQWLDLQSGSRRTGKTTPIGGLVGEFSLQGELAPALPWLLWGQVAQVGKNTVKGNGWYEVL